MKGGNVNIWKVTILFQQSKALSVINLQLLEQVNVTSAYIKAAKSLH